MKKLACAIAAIALIGTSAFAADMAVKAPSAPLPAPVYNWTGWHAGVNAGASFGNVKTDLNVAPATASGPSETGPTVNSVSFPGFAGASCRSENADSPAGPTSIKGARRKFRARPKYNFSRGPKVRFICDRASPSRRFRIFDLNQI